MNKKTKAGFITIGQSPRPYIMKNIRDILETTFDIIEDGALDGYDYDEILKVFPLNYDNDIVVTELSDNREILININYLRPLIQNSIERLEKKGAELVVLMCTAEMGFFRSNVFFVESSAIVKNIAEALGKGKRVGIFIPDAKQMTQMIKKWSSMETAEIHALSPYLNADETEKIIEKYNSKKWDMVVLDCMGYTEEIKNIISEKLSTKVLLSRSATARVVAELGCDKF